MIEDMTEFKEFLKTCSDMDLINMQSMARQVNDYTSLKVIMEELGVRYKAMLDKSDAP